MEQLSKIQQVEVKLHTKDPKGNKVVMDLNAQGLVSLEFERYLSDTSHRASNILTELNMTLFDTTGYDLMGAVQRAQGNLYLEYGFRNNLSPVYKLTPTKYNVVQNNRGIMLGIQGFGVQYEYQPQAESYAIGTPIRDLLIEFANRNGWYTGNNHEYIEVSSAFKTHKIIMREANLSDYDFIKREIVPLISTHSVFKDGTMRNMVTNATNLYQTILQENMGRVEFYIFPAGTRQIARKIWQYNYGTDTQSLIIEMTNMVDYSWIIDGITIRVPLVGEFLLKDDYEVEAELKEMMENRKEEIIALFKSNQIVLPELTTLTYKFQFYEASESEYKSTNELVEEKMTDILNTFNKMELTVVGHPKVMATDIIYINAKNKYGDNMIQNGFWRVTYIKEVIGLGGYQTKLHLVRETDDAEFKALMSPIQTTGTSTTQQPSSSYTILTKLDDKE